MYPALLVDETRPNGDLDMRKSKVKRRVRPAMLQHLLSSDQRRLRQRSRKQSFVGGAGHKPVTGFVIRVHVLTICQMTSVQQSSALRGHRAPKEILDEIREIHGELAQLVATLESFHLLLFAIGEVQKDADLTYLVKSFLPDKTSSEETYPSSTHVFLDLCHQEMLFEQSLSRRYVGEA